MASAIWLPTLNPAPSIATKIKSRAARLLSKFGANPPSSPMLVASPFFLSTDFKL